MVVKTSAGLLMYKIYNDGIKVFLIHPGGPFFHNKDYGSWTIPKGVVDDKENIIEAAKREFFEETGITPPLDLDKYIELGNITMKSGKIIYAWAFLKNKSCEFKCQTFFDLKWPPNTGKIQRFPEADKGKFFDIMLAKKKINIRQVQFIDRLEKKLNIKESFNKQVFLGDFK